MDKRKLPTSIEINNVECPIDSDFRNILDIFEIFNDPNLLDPEKIALGMQYLYTTDDFLIDPQQAATEMISFINCGEAEPSSSGEHKPQLYDWDKDFDIIVAPINRVMGTDIRGIEYLHWWTFMSAFMEIGECTFSTFMGIRNKLHNNIRLDKVEEKIYKENRDKIILTKKYDDTTQALMDEIMGKGF